MHDVIVPIFGLQVHTAIMIYLIVLMTIFFVAMRGKYRLVPGKAQSMIELTMDVFVGLIEETMGKKGKKYLPFILTFAIFIFVANCLGFIPGLFPPTANLNTTLGLALIVFLVTHIVGIKEHGVKYIKHFLGPVWWLMPLMLPLEIVGHFARPVSLSLRLFGNIMGHEQIIGVLLMLMPFALPLLIFSTVLGILVVFLQSFIFSLLAMLYIAGAIEEPH